MAIIVIQLTTILVFAVISILHLFPQIWATWDRKITDNRRMHIMVGLINFALAVANLVLIRLVH